MRIYTRTGDDGFTSLRAGDRISKTDPRIRANGAVDEANAMLGAALAVGLNDRIHSVVVLLQNDLFILGSDISNTDTKDDIVRVTKSMTSQLESIIDDLESTLSPLTNFILPGGHTGGAFLHLARSVVRRAELHLVETPEPINSECLRYINRLSDLLFVLARAANQDAGIPETIWAPTDGA